MKICNKTGNGICLNCPKLLPNSHGDVCRKDAEMLLDCLKEIINTDWTDEQNRFLQILALYKTTNGDFTN